MIKFSNGHELIFACGAGALGFDGRGWPWEWPLRWLGLLRPQDMTVVCKTVTMRPQKGNLRWYRPWSSVSPLGAGSWVNAIGLTNPGIDHWIKHDYKRGKSMGYTLAASIEPHSRSDAFRMGMMLSDLQLAYIEVNVSCPNTTAINDLKRVLTAVSCASEHPIVVKISYAQAMDVPTLEMVSSISGVEAIHAINTVPWNYLYPEKKSPLSRYGLIGGVSGNAIKHLTHAAVFQIKKHTQMPVIAGGGISNRSDITSLYESGANAYSIGSLFLSRPWRPNRIIKKCTRYDSWLNRLP